MVRDVQMQVVLAFEQTMTNMTQRLQQLALAASKKVSCVTCLLILLIVERPTAVESTYSITMTVMMTMFMQRRHDV